MNDLRFALRQLRRSPGFAALAILTLALGIGACTALFTVVNAVILRPLEYPESDRLMIVRETNFPEFLEFSLSPGNYRDYAKEQERSLYRALCQRVVKLREIEDVQLAVADMRVQEGRHEQSVKEAEVQRRKEAAQLDADRQALRDANRMKEKFVELARMHTAEMLKEFERKEEAEMEEVAETRHRPRNLHDGEEEEPQA